MEWFSSVFKTVAFAVCKMIVAKEELLTCNVVCDGVLAPVTLLSGLILLLSSFAEQIFSWCLFMQVLETCSFDIQIKKLPWLFNKFLRLAHTMKFCFHRWLNFSFDSFLSTFNTCIQLQNVNEIFQSRIMKVFQKKNLYQISGKNFFFWNTFNESKIKSLLKMR